MKVTRASTYGFCEGVRHALRFIDEAITNYPNQPIYLLNKIVHNDIVIQKIKEKGIIVLDDSRSLEQKINDISFGVIIFSAHGHDKKLDSIALKKGLTIIDATCPKVKYGFESIEKSLRQGREVFYIGIHNHPETVAALSLNPQIHFIDFKNPFLEKLPSIEKCSIHNQTTLIQSELLPIYDQIKKHCKDVEIINDVCFATSKRQSAINEITNEDLILIIGDPKSSNTMRLFEIAKKKYPTRGVFSIPSLVELKKLDL